MKAQMLALAVDLEKKADDATDLVGKAIEENDPLAAAYMRGRASACEWAAVAIQSEIAAGESTMRGGDDMTIEEIATMSGVSQAAIRARIARGSRVDGPNRKNASRPSVFVNGRTIAEIAAENGISRQAAGRRIRVGTAIDGPNRQNEGRPKAGRRGHAEIAKSAARSEVGDEETRAEDTVMDCHKCNDTGTVYESHGTGGREPVDCECREASAPYVPSADDDAAGDAADHQAAMSSGIR